ncbi:hypothetical protein TNIN_439481 [Trichonephila inaurata madagascariensis]|uniref:Uncharacterized protein n=1 Tax=Trichonephila inaurata madagascariensis TaxID=2747483 RepID=A0A8X7CF56_9ARAC|nr:hypothetical protein TNIN_439481 [Trichonephila inaurata madagascariensis]
MEKVRCPVPRAFNCNGTQEETSLSQSYGDAADHFTPSSTVGKEEGVENVGRIKGEKKIQPKISAHSSPSLRGSYEASHCRSDIDLAQDLISAFQTEKREKKKNGWQSEMQLEGSYERSRLKLLTACPGL